MQIQNLKADIEYYPSIEMYKVILSEFKVNGEHPSFYLTPTEVPREYMDQYPKFKVGDLVDKFYPDIGHREYYGRIIEIETRQYNSISPKRVFYYTDIWTKQRSSGVSQDDLQLSLNPHID